MTGYSPPAPPAPIDLREIIWMKRQWALALRLMRRANIADTPRAKAIIADVARKNLDEYYDKIDHLLGFFNDRKV